MTTSAIAPTPTPTPASQPDYVTAILTALTGTNVTGHYDQEMDTVFAYPAGTPQDQALHGGHVMIDCETSDTTTGGGEQQVQFDVTAWTHGRTGSPLPTDVYQTPTPRTLTAEAQQCVKAVVEHFTVPRPTAGTLLSAALAKHGIIPVCDDPGMIYVVPLDPDTATADAYTSPRLSIGDRNASTGHLPAAHTGWTVFPHDGNGGLAGFGEPLYIAGDGELVVDCTEDAATAAAVIAGYLTTLSGTPHTEA